jgi:hypothetical protein
MEFTFATVLNLSLTLRKEYKNRVLTEYGAQDDVWVSLGGGGGGAKKMVGKTA